MWPVPAPGRPGARRWVATRLGLAETHCTLMARPTVSADQLVVAIDLGGTKALAGVVDADGTVRSRVWLPSRDLIGRPAELLDRLADGAGDAARQADVPFEAIAAVGVCVPGPLDSSRSV